MKGLRPWLGLAVAVGSLIAALGWLFQLRLGGGDVYPEYSSLRADALGTRALYEALEQIPGMEVSRDYRPLSQLGTKPRLLVLAGQWWESWRSVPAPALETLTNAATNGARVVLAFRADVKRDQDQEIAGEEEDAGPKDGVKPDEKKNLEDKDAKSKPAKTEPKKKKPKQPGDREWERKDLGQVWGVTLKHRWLFTHEDGAKRAAWAPAQLPETVTWHSDLHFQPAAHSGWWVLYQRAGVPVMIEKKVGRGSIVLVADAYSLSNEAMSKSRATALLTWLIGDQRQVVFAEGALGVLEENGLGSLARRYGLGGALALCVLLGLLYAWRRLVAFLPVQDDELAEGTPLSAEPAAAFTGLLRRSLGARDILPACVEEWRKVRPGRGVRSQAMARLNAAWQDRNPKQSLVATYNALVQALKSR